MAQASAEAVVTKYLDVLYNERRLDLIPELISDPTWRHHAGEDEILLTAHAQLRRAVVVHQKVRQVIYSLVLQCRRAPAAQVRALIVVFLKIVCTNPWVK